MENNNYIGQPDWEKIAEGLYNTEKTSDNQPLSVPENLSTTDAEVWKESEKLSRQIDVYFNQKKYSEEIGWQKITEKIHQPKDRNRQLHLFLRIAAIIVFAFVTGSLAYFYLSTNNRNSEKILTAQNEVVTSFLLPDSTRVSLNSGTKLYYPEQFSGDTRVVTIEGEAFFEVKPNKLKPFIIYAGNMQVKVLGTSFNVNAYPGSDKVEVIVETGKVQVSNKKSKTTLSNELILTPGEKATLSNSNKLLLKSANKDENFLAWKTRSLIFRHTSLDEVIAQLEKVYKVDILLEDPIMNDLPLTARFDNHSIDFIMEIISSTHKLDVEVKDNRYLLKNRR